MSTINKIVAMALVACAAVTLSGCYPQNANRTPMAITPMPRIDNVQTAGSIYQPNTATAWFETPVAHRVGDLLTIQVSETSNGTNKVSTDISRTSSVTSKSAKADGAESVLERWFNIGSAADSFKGSGASSSSTNMVGTIAVAIVDVLPNGSYIVAGEKQVMQGRNTETFRLTGMVNKYDIQPGNTVASSKVGQATVARVETGAVADGGSGGWLQRILLGVSPF